MNKGIYYRDDLEAIFQAGIRRVDPRNLIREAVCVKSGRLQINGKNSRKSFVLSDFERIFVIGFGKASANMALAIEELLGDRISDGIISVKYGHTASLNRIRLMEAGHPVPDASGLMAAQAILELAGQADEKTLVITLISGGGSALTPSPLKVACADGDIRLTLAEKQEITRILLGCGATINEMNTVRKHFSGIKGGRLAERITPATCVSLILSDVVGDDLDVIASGATTPDSSTFGNVMAIFDRYDILDQVPWNARRILSLGLEKSIPETPDLNHAAFSTVHNILVGTNTLALEACRIEAQARGYATRIVTSQLVGEARQAASDLFEWAIKQLNRSSQKPACLLYGGETTVTLRGTGKGGRNQEMALAFLSRMASDPQASEMIHFLSAGTDGSDGPTDAAGAFADHELLQSAGSRDLSIDRYLENNDAYHFFESLDGLLKTGPTNTNVCDIQVILIAE